MDAAAVLWAVLGAVALLAGAVLLVVPAAGRRRQRPGDLPPPAPGPAFPDDDLPAFRATPPGTPGAAAARPPARVLPAPVADPDDAPSAGRVVVAMAAAALLLLGVLAVVAGISREGTADSGAGRADSSPTSARPVPELPEVPPAPAPGAAGAGGLAHLSVPLDAGGRAARLSFAPLVLEHRAVGTTVTSPALSVTARGDGTALAHVRLPIWNCLSTEAPADPLAAGCTPGPVEYADLPSPALATEADDDVLRLTGRFPTYTRPNGGPPVYTGRVYELTVSLGSDGAADPGAWAPASGTLFLGTDRAESVPDRALSAVLVGG
ncbi:hypothetical protein [Blastococcus sp. URHD0036]|uniref:hypothetical protein n=1 Tax=Blastococcus sp. URHD0036 TaxID=1380356 RepID=UPI0012DDB806|nr:hypothetical protein [Blastococcus sp. URHD0036]